jgi:hypothetical protein
MSKDEVESTMIEQRIRIPAIPISSHPDLSRTTDTNSVALLKNYLIGGI